MEKINLTNTNAGLSAIQRAMAGEDILFTKLEIGDGVLVNTDVGGYTGLVNKTKDFPLAAVKAEESEIIRLRSNISNHGVTQDLLIREYGIYAKFGNEQEFLFAYLNVGDTPTPLPNQTVGRYELNRDFILYIGNSPNVDFTSNGGVVYATLNDLKKLEKNLNRESLFNYIFDKPNYSPNPELTACRIPGIAVTNKGTLMAVCDLRAGFNDVPNKIKIGLRKSYDKGLTWTDTKVIMDLGDSDQQGISDPCIVHNPETGRTFCFALNLVSGNVNNASTSWGFYMTYSDDDGENWSELRQLNNLAPEGFRIIFQGPGNGCFYKSPSGVKNIIIPVQCWQGPDGIKSRSGIMYSYDNGATWTVSTLVDRVTSECAVTVYKNTLYLSCKDESYKYGRFLYKSTNMGQTWTEVIQDTYSTSTQGSLLTITGEDTTAVMVKCENNGLGAGTPRTDMTIKVSEDGMIWKEVVQVRDANGLGYSSLACDNDFLYVHYETNAGCAFKRFPIQMFKDKAVKSLEYNSSSLLNPQVIGEAIYIQNTTEVVEIKTDITSTPIRKIYNSVAGKRIRLSIVGSNASAVFKTGSGEYAIRDVRIGAGKDFILNDGDSIILYMTPTKDWLIEDIVQLRPHKMTGQAIIETNGIIDLNNNLVSLVEISGSCTIKNIININSRGKITFIISEGDVILDVGGTRVDGEPNRRVLLNANSSFELISNFGGNASNYINIISCINTMYIDSANYALLNYNAETKSIETFDNINMYVLGSGAPAEFMNGEIQQILFRNPFSGSVKFFFWVPRANGKFINKAEDTTTKENYSNIYTISGKQEATFTLGSVIELIKGTATKVSPIKY